MQNLNSDHPTFLTNRAFGNIDTGEHQQALLPGYRHLFVFHINAAAAKDLTTESDSVPAFSVCQQTIVAYLHKPVRQYMQKESSDELEYIQSHDLFLLTVSVVTPEEGDPAVVDLEDTVITDGYPVSIPSQVLQDTTGPVEGRLAIYHPLRMIEPPSEYPKGMRWCKGTDNSWEEELS